MITFLIAISFLLHAICLFALILLFQRQNNMMQTEKAMQQTAAETEEMMTAFLMELKEENERLLKQLSENVPEQKKFRPKAGEAQQEEILPPPIMSRKAVAKAYTSIKKEQEAAPVAEELSQAEHVIALKNQGLSDEDIARKLQIGITEVKLSLKFYRSR